MIDQKRVVRPRPRCGEEQTLADNHPVFNPARHSVVQQTENESVTRRCVVALGVCAFGFGVIPTSAFRDEGSAFRLTAALHALY
jgi:hypothetical protein